MTDLEMVRLCAEAMGYASVKTGGSRGPGGTGNVVWVADSPDADHLQFNPLSGLFSDAQAMALVKRFVNVIVKKSDGRWAINLNGAVDANLNRAICQCVANMQLAKGQRDE